MKWKPFWLKASSAVVLGLLTACTGTSEPLAAFKVVVQEQTAANTVALRALEVQENVTPLTPLTLTGVGTGLHNTQNGNLLFAGFEDRIEVYTGDAEAETGLKLSRTLQVGEGEEFTIPNCSNPVKLSRPDLSPNEGFLVVLGQCGTSETESRQRLWIINLSSGNWTPTPVWDNLANRIRFFVAGNDRLFFAQQVQSIQDHILYAVSYIAPFNWDSSGAQKLPTTLKDLEFWQGNLRFTEGTKIRTINSVTTLEGTDLVTFAANSLIRKQNQLLAVGSSTACLLDSTPVCSEGSDVISGVSDVRDVTFDLNGYAWILSGSTLYRVDIVANNKRTEFINSFTNPKGVAWVVN